MYYLVYTKQRAGYAQVGLVCVDQDNNGHKFECRADVLRYAIETCIRLNEYDTVIIGPNGRERGSADPHEELEQLALAEVKNG